MVFTKFMRCVLKALRHPRDISGRWAIKEQLTAVGEYFVSAFLDNLLLLAQSGAKAKLLCTLTLDLLSKLGICVHLHKCDLSFADTIDHLGFCLDIVNKLYCLTAK